MFECKTSDVVGCSAGKLNLCVCKGDDFNEEISWVREVSGKTIPMNLRGYSAIMTVISAHNTKEEKVLELQNPTGIFLDNNKIILSIPRQVISNFSWSKGDYSLAMVSPTGLRKTILKGRFTISGSPNCCH
jgi:hypothetical protein